MMDDVNERNDHRIDVIHDVIHNFGPSLNIIMGYILYTTNFSHGSSQSSILRVLFDFE